MRSGANEVATESYSAYRHSSSCNASAPNWLPCCAGSTVRVCLGQLGRTPREAFTLARCLITLSRPRPSSLTPARSKKSVVQYTLFLRDLPALLEHIQVGTREGAGRAVGGMLRGLAQRPYIRTWVPIYGGDAELHFFFQSTVGFRQGTCTVP